MKKQKKKRAHLTAKNLRGIQPKILGPIKYPINPIIVFSDQVVVDGQHVLEVCKLENIPFKTLVLDYTEEDFKNPRFIDEFRQIITRQQKLLDREMKAHRMPPYYEITMTSSFFKIRKFYSLRNKFKGVEYWGNLIHTYNTSDNNRYNQEILRELFRSGEPGKETLFTPEVMDIYNSLSDKVTIYRGMTLEEYESGQFGISWTLDPEVAHKFKDTYWRNLDTNHLAERIVHQLEIDKDDIIAIILDRNESEIIYIHN